MYSAYTLGLRFRESRDYGGVKGSVLRYKLGVSVGLLDGWKMQEKKGEPTSITVRFEVMVGSPSDRSDRAYIFIQHALP